MIAFSALLIGLGLGMGLTTWLGRNRPSAELDDLQDTLDRTRVDLHNARAELIRNEQYTTNLLDDPGFYVAQRNSVPDYGR